MPSRARCLGKVRLDLPGQAPVVDSPWAVEAKEGFPDHLVPEETASPVLWGLEDHRTSRVSLIALLVGVKSYLT